jgi:hypothetical protein
LRGLRWITPLARLCASRQPLLESRLLESPWLDSPLLDSRLLDMARSPVVDPREATLLDSLLTGGLTGRQADRLPGGQACGRAGRLPGGLTGGLDAVGSRLLKRVCRVGPLGPVPPAQLG